ncbi:MAG: DNA polymerase III subunit delta' [Candidatus Omnitrophota bacterium]
MALLRDIKGQDTAVSLLSSTLASGRTAKSYLFCGPAGVGKALTAKAFIMGLFCRMKDMEGGACGVCPSCLRVKSLSHPDVKWIAPEKNKKIKIEQIRDIKDILNLKPYESPASVCVIEDAHMMTVEASNALLKILEEPPGHSLMILTTDKKELVTETVVSRCAEVRFRYLSMRETAEIIKSGSGTDERQAFFLACFSQGSPGNALRMLNDGILERRDKVIRMMEEIVEEKNSSCMNWDEEDKDVLIEDLDLMIMIFRDISLGREGLTEMVMDKNLVGTSIYRFFVKYPARKMFGTLSRLVELKLAVLSNVNPKLVAQRLPGCIK